MQIEDLALSDISTSTQLWQPENAKTPHHDAQAGLAT